MHQGWEIRDDRGSGKPEASTVAIQCSNLLGGEIMKYIVGPL